MPLENLDQFLDEYNTRSAEPSFDADQFNQDFQRGLNTSGVNRTQPTPVSDKGFLRETTEAVAGGVTDAAEMWMRAIRTVDPEGGNDVIRDFATSGLSAIQNFISRHPSLAPDANVHEGVKRWWVEGVRAFVPSLSAAIPGIVGGAAVGGPVGAVVGSTFGGAIFGLAEFDRFKEEVEDFITDNELSREDAAILREQGASKAVYSAVTEGGLEGAANALEVMSLGLFRPVRRTIQGVVTQPIKQLFKKSAGQIAKEAAIRLPRTAAIEVGTEVTQEALETKFRRDIGLTDLSSIDAAMSVIGPSLVTTLLFLGAAGGANSFQRYSIRKSLEAARANPNKRKQAVREISEIVRATGQPDSEALADRLQAAGNRFIDEGISIDLNTQVGVQNALGEIVKGLRLGELNIDNTLEYERKLAEALQSEELTGAERIKSTQLLQGISTINLSFEAQAPAAKPKIKKRPATASDKLRDLGDAATTKGKAPVVREEVEEEVEASEALEELAEEVTEPTAKEEIPVEEPEVEEIRAERKVRIEEKAPEEKAKVPAEERQAAVVEKIEEKPAEEMTLEEINQQIEQGEKSDKEIAIEIFGKEKAKRYERLFRRANSTTISVEKQDEASRELAKMEDSLTKKQQNRLFGIGEDIIDVDLLKDFRDEIQFVRSQDESATSLGESLKFSITNVGEKTNPSEMNQTELTAFIGIREAFEIAKEKGFNLNEVSNAAIKASAVRFTDIEDAKFMLSRFIKQEPTEVTPKLLTEEEKEAFAELEREEKERAPLPAIRLKDIDIQEKPVSELDAPLQNVVKEEARLMREEIEKGLEGERIFVKDAFGVIEPEKTFASPTTNPPYYLPLTKIGLKKGQNRRKRTVINALKNIENIREKPNPLSIEIKKIIEDRLQGKAQRYTPGTGQQAPERGNIFVGEIEPITREQQALAEIETPIDKEAQEAATSIVNDEPQPSQEQIEAGNYKKGHIALQGLDISIENPKGSERSGFTKEGEPWTTIAVHHYGYIKGTVGRDKDHLDAYIGDSPASENVYVINQVDPDTGKFDEHKVMIGFNTEEEARTGYLANYEEGWQGLGSMIPMSMDEFKTWIEGDTTQELKPIVEKELTEKELLERDLIRLKRKGFGAGRRYEYRAEDGIFTVAPSKEEAIKRANAALAAKQEAVAPEVKEEIEEVAVPEAVPADIQEQIKIVQLELDDATAVFVAAETKGKAKKEARAKVEELQKRRKQLRIAAGIELNPVDQSKKNITDKMGAISLGADPSILKDMAVVGAHHFNSGLKTFTSWSKAMINDLGKSIKSFLRRVWRTVRKGGIKTDETTQLQKEAVEIEQEQHSEEEIQAEQIKIVEATGKTIDEGKETPDIIAQLNNFITHNDYNVLHDDNSKNEVKQVFPDIQDEDISTLARISSLPYWKKQPEWKRAVGIEIKRTENKNLLKFEFGRRVFKRSEVEEGSRADIHEFFALKGESYKRVSAVILEGDARRTEFTNKSLKEGIKTTELDKIDDAYKEFRGKSIKLNEEEITAYRAWQVTMKKIRRKLVEANENLLYKPFEGKPWLKDLRTVVAKKAEQIKPVQATLEITEAQKEEAVKAPELTARDIPKGLSDAEQKEFAKAYNKVIKPKGRIQALRKQMGELKGYVPHLRDEGTIKVSFTDKEGQVRDSNILKNDRQANKYITERRAFHKARGNEYTVSKERVARTPEFLYQQVSAAALERFSNKALDRFKTSKEGKEPGKITAEDLDEIREGMKQALSDELSARGFGERTLKRTRGPNIGGYRVADLKDIMAGYISGASGFMTKMEAAYEQGQLLSDIDVKAKPNLYQEISIYGRNMMRNLTRSDQISSKVRTFAFVWYLSGQLKSPTVNFTQNYILGIPTLAKFTTGARRKYNRAMFDISTNRLSDIERKALLEAQKKGTTGDQLMQDIFGQMSKNTSKPVQKVIKILSFPFSFSEILNRRFAFLARFRAGIEKGETYKQAVEGARTFVLDVHFLYGKENQALIASGGTPFSNVLRTSLTFRNYTFNYLNAMKNHIGDRNFALVGRSMAYMALLGGLSSLPFLEDFLDMWERMTGIPIRKKVQQELKGVGGDVLAVMGTQGLPSLIGIDLSGSLRIHLPDPTNPARMFEESVFGVYEGLAVKAKDSFQSILDGEPLRALEHAAPIFIEKPLKALRVSRDGRVTTKTGKTIFTGRGRPLKITTPEAIVQSIGFRPSKLAFESGKFRQFTNIEANFRNRRTRLFRKLRFAKTKKDRSNVLQAIKEYNEDARKQRGAVPLITSESLRRTQREIPSKRFRAFSRA